MSYLKFKVNKDGKTLSVVDMYYDNLNSSNWKASKSLLCIPKYNCDKIVYTILKNSLKRKEPYYIKNEKGQLSWPLIKSIYIPKSVKYIQENAFNGYENLDIYTDNLSIPSTWSFPKGFNIYTNFFIIESKFIIYTKTNNQIKLLDQNELFDFLDNLPDICIPDIYEKGIKINFCEKEATNLPGESRVVDKLSADALQKAKIRELQDLVHNRKNRTDLAQALLAGRSILKLSVKDLDEIITSVKLHSSDEQIWLLKDMHSNSYYNISQNDVTFFHSSELVIELPSFIGGRDVGGIYNHFIYRSQNYWTTNNKILISTKLNQVENAIQSLSENYQEPTNLSIFYNGFESLSKKCFDLFKNNYYIEDDTIMMSFYNTQIHFEFSLIRCEKIKKMNKSSFYCVVNDELILFLLFHYDLAYVIPKEIDGYKVKTVYNYSNQNRTTGSSRYEFRRIFEDRKISQEGKSNFNIKNRGDVNFIELSYNEDSKLGLSYFSHEKYYGFVSYDPITFSPLTDESYVNHINSEEKPKSIIELLDYNTSWYEHYREEKEAIEFLRHKHINMIRKKCYVIIEFNTYNGIYKILNFFKTSFDAEDYIIKNKLKNHSYSYQYEHHYHDGSLFGIPDRWTEIETDTAWIYYETIEISLPIQLCESI